MSAFDKRPHIMKLAVDAGGPERLMDIMRGSLNPDGHLATVNDFISGGELQRLSGDLYGRIPEGAPLKNGYRSAVMALSAFEDLDGFKIAFERIKEFLFTKDGAARKHSPLSKEAARTAAVTADPSLKGKAKDEAAKALKEEHDTAYEKLRETVGKLARVADQADGARALLALLGLFFGAEKEYAAASRSDGLVDFDDLEICAYRLIMRPQYTGLMSLLEHRGSHFLVDEFQDTGELQWGIISRLASEAFSGSGAQGTASPTVFAVGDVKQSIYRFRMANRRLMDRLRMRMRDTIEPSGRDFPELDHNFRCAPEILRVVDETFSALLPGEYRPALGHRGNARGSVTLRLEPHASEPEALAEAVESALGLPVWDNDAYGTRPANYGDMSVLLRSRARLGSYEDTLRSRGIPFKVVGGVGFFRQPEVRAVIGLLGFIDDPSDPLRLAVALKSPLFGLSDKELEPLYGPAAPMDALAGISPAAFRLVSGWRSLAGVSPPGKVVARIIEETAAAFVFGLAYGPSALLNIEMLASTAAEFDRRGGVGVAEFIEWVRAYREGPDIAGADVELPEYSEYVSVMTVHAAKGLEFPVVFLPGTDFVPRSAPGGFIAGTLEPGDMGVYTDSLMGDNPIYKKLKEQEKEETLDEAKRLMYVAMTRAMDHLCILAGCRPGRDGLYQPRKGSWAWLLTEAAPRSILPTTGDGMEFPASHHYPAVPLTGTRTFPVEARTLGRFMDATPDPEMLAPLHPSTGLRFVSPSSLASSCALAPYATAPYPAALRGAAIHRAIEVYGRTGDLDAYGACASRQGFAAIGPEAAAALVADVERTVSRFLENDIVKKLFSPSEGRHFELPLMLIRGGEVVYGSADLVVVEDEAATVYDFKSGLAGLQEDKVAACYEPQLLAYSDAVKEAFGMRDVSSYIVLVEGPAFIRIGA